MGWSPRGLVSLTPPYEEPMRPDIRGVPPRIHWSCGDVASGSQGALSGKDSFLLTVQNPSRTRVPLMKRSIVLAAMIMLTAACAGTPHGASTAPSSTSRSVPSVASATAAPSTAPSSQSTTSAPATSPTPSATRTTTGPATGRVVYLAEGIYFQSAAAINSIPWFTSCLLYTSPSPRDGLLSRMP